MTQPEEDRDLAHEADMLALMRQQLRDNISPEEAAEEIEDWDEGDPDEYGEEPCCACNAVHVPVELDGGRCWSCGELIA